MNMGYNNSGYNHYNNNNGYNNYNPMNNMMHMQGINMNTMNMAPIPHHN